MNLQNEFFEKTALKHPNYIAVDDHGKKTSYKNLENFSNKLANLLHENGCRTNDRVCIFTNKNINQYASILGILKSGSCWVPLSAAFPKDRIKYLLKTLTPKFIIVEEIYYKKISKIYNKSITKILIIDKTFKKKSLLTRKDVLSKSIKKPIIKNICGSDLAYIIFTSGSTGKPKGVMVTHENTSQYLKNSLKYFKIKKKLTFGHIAELTFDPSIFDIFICWMNAGTVVPFNKQIYRINHFEFFKRNKNINAFFSVPSFIKNLDDIKKLKSPELSKIKHLVFGGEPIPKGLASNLYSSIKNIKVYNVYGTTETAIISHWYLIPKKIKFYDEISVGKELPNFRVILVKNNKEAKINEAGDVHVYGPQVSPGYWNNSFLTNLQFVKHPFDNRLPQKVYRTGDLLRKDKNGMYYFVGRTDNQVKIRGHRVELEEVENCIKQIEGVNDSVAIAYSRTGKASSSDLFVFVRTNNTKINKTYINNLIQKKLPSFMYPSDIFIFKEDFPRTQNGKVDKKGLIKKILEYLA